MPTELTLSEIKKLHAQSLEHLKGSGSAPCLVLYRNKNRGYYDEIFEKSNGIMKPYVKDLSGDPGSPINGRIKGLFFMASVEPGSTSGDPMRASAFGDTRLLVPAKVMLQKAPNLYFTDFYCMKGTYHYITIVMTKTGSEADAFCRQRLMPLSIDDPASNPFLFKDPAGGLQVSTKKSLIVEMFFTEELDITAYKNNLQGNTPLIGKGQTTPGGVPKNARCGICNLR